MGHEPQPRPVAQDADLNQTNDQQVDQGNTQDASHHSDTQQDVALIGRQTQVDQQRVLVSVENHLATAAGPAACALQGRVVDACAQPVPGCLVEVFFGPLVGIPIAVAETDNQGAFRLDDLLSGYYSLRVTAPGDMCLERWHHPLAPGLTGRLLLTVDAVSPQPRRRRRPTTAAVTSADAGESAP